MEKQKNLQNNGLKKVNLVFIDMVGGGKEQVQGLSPKKKHKSYSQSTILAWVSMNSPL